MISLVSGTPVDALQAVTTYVPVERAAGVSLPCVCRLHRPGQGRAGPCLEHRGSHFGYRESAVIWKRMIIIILLLGSIILATLPKYQPASVGWG